MILPQLEQGNLRSTSCSAAWPRRHPRHNTHLVSTRNPLLVSVGR